MVTIRQHSTSDSILLTAWWTFRYDALSGANVPRPFASKPLGRVRAHASLVLLARASIPAPDCWPEGPPHACYYYFIPSVDVSVACALVPDSFICWELRRALFLSSSFLCPLASPSTSSWLISISFIRNLEFNFVIDLTSSCCSCTCRCESLRTSWHCHGHRGLSSLHFYLPCR